jgi:hypothetical protein
MHKGTYDTGCTAAGGRIARRAHIRTVLLERERLTGTLTNAGCTKLHWPWPYRRVATETEGEPKIS